MIKIYEIKLAKLQKIKNVLEAQDTATGELDVEIEKEAGKGNLEKAKAWRVNEFKKNGYILREARALGIEKKVSYLYISGDEKFFERNEKVLFDLGAKVLGGKDAQEIKEKIEALEQGASEGIGFIFG